MSREVLITGGSGFIGTHLVADLLAAGHGVRILDLVAPRTKDVGVEYVRGDVRDLEQVRSASRGMAAIVHLAALVSVPLCQREPVESYRTNMTGTLNVLEASRLAREQEGKTPRVIFASSAAVYGDSGKAGIPLEESGALPEPLSFYAAQKRASEQALGLYAAHFGIPTLALRFFNVFGPGQDPSSPYSGVITVFSECLKAGRPLRLNGGGTQTRDFVAVKDVARACRSALDLPAERCLGQAINIGSGAQITIRQLAEEMTRLYARNPGVQDAPIRNGDVLHSFAAIRLAEERLGWRPAVVLSEGLKQLV